MKMKRVVGIGEWLLAVLLIAGGMNTTASAMADSSYPAYVVVIFGLAFLLAGVLIMVGKINHKKNLRQAGLILAVAALLFGAILDVLQAPADWAGWIDSVLIFALAVFIRIRVYLEGKSCRRISTLTRSTALRPEPLSVTETLSTRETR